MSSADLYLPEITVIRIGAPDYFELARAYSRKVTFVGKDGSEFRVVTFAETEAGLGIIEEHSNGRNT